MGDNITTRELKRADIKNVKRLALFLKLNIEGLSDRQIIKLVAWRLKKFRKPQY